MQYWYYIFVVISALAIQEAVNIDKGNCSYCNLLISLCLFSQTVEQNTFDSLSSPFQTYGK